MLKSASVAVRVWTVAAGGGAAVGPGEGLGAAELVLSSDEALVAPASGSSSPPLHRGQDGQGEDGRDPGHGSGPERVGHGRYLQSPDGADVHGYGVGSRPVHRQAGWFSS
jgi:hypothetical protein